MPIVPTTGPTVETRAAPFVPASAAGATPDAFGASVGAATSQLGVAGFRAGNELNTVATDMAIQASTRAAKTADAADVSTMTNLGYANLPGGPDGNRGYFSLKGQAAVDHLPTYLASLQAGQAANVKSFGDDQRAANMYQAQASMRIAEEQKRASAYAMGQGQVADVDASNSRISAYTDAYTADYNNPAALSNFQKVITGEVQTQARLHGWDTDTTDAALKQTLSKGYAASIKTAAISNPTQAGAMFTSLAPQMDTGTRVALAQHLEPKIVGAQADAIVNQLLGGSGRGANTGTSGAGGNLENAILGQEATPDGRTSIDGARGRYQIMPDTFKQYAQPGESIDNPADNAAVGKRILADYSQKYNGDASRVAVAYFSGPGNVAPAGSATPYKEDTHDGNHFFVSQYVNGVLGRMNGGTGVATPPAGNATDANPSVHPDFAGMQQKLLDATTTDPTMRAATLSRLHQAASEYELSTQAARDSLEKNQKDTIAALSAGNDTVEIPEAQIRHAFRPDVADHMVAEMEEARSDGQMYKQISTATPEQLAATRADLASGQGPMAVLARLRKGAVQARPGADQATGDNTSEDPTAFVARQKALAKFDAMVSKRNAALTDDPAGYAQANVPGVTAAYAAVDGNKPETLQAAAQASISAQRSLGVSDDATRVLTATQAAGLVKQLHSVDPEKGDAGAALDNMAHQYGDQWPAVFKDMVQVGKLDPAFQALAVMDQPSQVGPRQNLQRALQAKAEAKGEFGKAVPNGEKQPLEHGIDDTLADFQRTTTFGGSDLFSRVVKPAVTTLATYYAGQGIPGGEAASRAYNEIIGAKYDISGPTRTPKGLMPAVQAAGDQVLSGLKAEDLAPNTASLAQARNGVWATTPDGAGVALMAKSVSGSYLPVRGKDGKMITMQFNNLPKAQNYSALPDPSAAGVQ